MSLRLMIVIWKAIVGALFDANSIWAHNVIRLIRYLTQSLASNKSRTHKGLSLLQYQTHVTVSVSVW